MKKILSLALCAVMVLCAVVPCFAAGGTMTSFGDSSPFNKGWLVTTKSVLDYVDDQPVLFNNTDYWASKGAPNYSVAGFYPDSRGYITLWGGNNAANQQKVWADKPTFQIPFTVAEDGLYSFAFIVGGKSTGAVGIPCRVDDGDWYNVMTDTTNYNAPGTYYGMNNIALTAGEHVFHFSCPVGSMDTQYYYGVKITGEKLTPEAPAVPEEPEINYNLSYVTSLPQAFSGATYVAAKDTIAELNADLPYTIYGEPTYPVGDLFNGAVALGDGSSSYQFKINVPEDGDYSFAFLLSSGGNMGRGLAAITIDGEGTPYTAVSDGKLGFKQYEYYTGMMVTLTKGEHIVCIQGAKSNPYFHGFYFYRAADASGGGSTGPVTISSTKPSAAFFGAKVTTINFIDCIDDQPELFNNTGRTNSSGAFSPDYSKAGFAADSRGFITLWGGNNQDNADRIWADLPTYQVKFVAPVAGNYSFAFTMGGSQKGDHYVPICVDGGKWYHVAYSTSAYNNPNTYYGMDNIYLEAGEHVFHFSKAVGTMETQYYWSMSYTYVEGGADSDGDMMAAPMNPIPGVVVTPSIPGGSSEMALQNLINPVPDTDASDNAPVEDPLAPPQPNMDATAPAVPGGMGSAQWAPAMPACTVR